MRRTDDGDSSRWGGPRWLGRLGWILLAATLVIFLISVVSEGALTWGSLGRALSGLTAVGVIVLSRLGTRATTSELETTGRGVRARRIPWEQVSDLRADQPNRWAEVVEAHLVDGSTVPLAGVPPADLPRLQDLRQRATPR